MSAKGKSAIFAALALLAGLSPAVALMPPYVYENARREAPNVIVLAVLNVSLPPARGWGDCEVSGSVRKVERGSLYKIGQSVRIAVPCVGKDARPPLGGTIYQQVHTLRLSHFGRAYLDAGGKLVVSQYEQLDAVP